MMKKRENSILENISNLPAFRLKQIQSALFDTKNSTWNDVSTLPKEMRKKMEENISWISLKPVLISESDSHDSKKALLRTVDDFTIESVLIKNSRGHWSACVSVQVGCAMNCAFCATGDMGLKRSLTSDEIVDQLRFWQKNIESDERITNIVYMGMGEPLANYVEVRESLNMILDNTEIGPTRITVSTVGILPRLWQLLEDPLWPNVKIAISLHSANQETRKEIMPSTAPDFLKDLKDWCDAYLKKFGNRRHHITFEYLLLKDVNDSIQDAKKLAEYVKKIKHIKINLIAYNQTESFDTPSQSTVNKFLEILKNRGIDATRRKSLGGSIKAACGQLACNDGCKL